MKIPKKFTLAGLQWTVEEVKGLSDMGQCDYGKSVIRIQKELSPQMKAATFCHELQHAIRFASGKYDHDEVEVDAQGHLLHQFLEQYGRL